MSLDTGNQFNEAGTSAADFDPQDQVLPNSPVLSADVNTVVERAIRRTRYLTETKFDKTGGTINGAVTITGPSLTLGNATTLVSASARSYTRASSGLLYADTTIWTNPGVSGEGFPYLALQSSTVSLGALADMLVYAIDPPHGATITSVTVRAKGAAAHPGLPVSLPIVGLYKADLTTGVTTLVGSQADTTLSSAAYKLLHTITIAGLSEYVDATTSAYVVRVQGDSGSGGVYGSEMYAPLYTFDRAAIGEE
jgi:hypothetical protein